MLLTFRGVAPMMEQLQRMAVSLPLRSCASKPGRHRVHYSVVTRTELFAVNAAIDLCSRLLASFPELSVDRVVAERAGRIAREFGTRTPDALIAATAIEHKLSIVTQNRKHFEPIRGVRVRSLR